MDDTPNLKYWRAFWLETALKVRYIGGTLDFAAPAFLVQDLMAELTLSRLERAPVRQAYLALARRTRKRIVVREHFAPEFDCVIESLSEWRGWEYSLRHVELASSAVNRTYGALAAARLAALLDGSELEPAGKIQLAELTNDLVVGLLVSGCSLQLVATVPGILLDEAASSTRVQETFEHGVNEADDDFVERVDQYLAQLSIQQRLRALKSFFEPTPVLRRYIFQLRGLRIKDEFHIGDVTIYDPFETPKIRGDHPPIPSEAFGEKPDANYRFPNIAVSLSCDSRDSEGAAGRAREVASRCVD
jgi:hypothetical protein